MEPMLRRAAAGMLAVFGLVLMLAAPDTLPGLAVLALAVGIEVVGIRDYVARAERVSGAGIVGASDNALRLRWS